MTKGQYAGLYKSPGHFEDPEDYMNMADSMDYFRTFGAAPESVIDSNFRARQKFAPIEPENDEIIGLRNLEALKDNHSANVDNPTYGFMKLAEMAKAGKLAPQSITEQPQIQPDMHTNEAFAYYTKLRDKLKKEIEETEAKIAFKDKVKKIKARMDPLWKAARIQAIFTGDMTPLKNIMDRYDQLEKAERDEAYRYKALQQTADLSKMNKEVEDNQKKESYKKNLRNKLKLANFAYREYPDNDAQSRAHKFNAYMDLMNAAEDLNLNEEDISKLLPPDVYEGLSVIYNNVPVSNKNSATFANTKDLTSSVENDINNKDFDKALNDIEQNKGLFVGGETDAELTALKQKVEIAKKNSDTASAEAAKKEAEEEVDRQARDEIQRINNMPRGKAKTAAIDQFFVDHPNYISGTDKDGKFAPTKKESKKKK